MFFVKTISAFALLALSACDVTMYSGSDGRQAAIAAGMPTFESDDTGAAQTRATRQMQPIIAFGSRGNLTECLDRLTSPAQLLAANDGSIVRGGNCSFGKPVVGFRAFPADFHVTARFIFPIFRIDVAGQSAQPYSHDGIFARRDWQLVREVGFNACTPRQMARYDGCLIPNRCETLDAFERSGQIATFWRDTGYIRRTEQCRPFTG